MDKILLGVGAVPGAVAAYFIAQLIVEEGDRASLWWGLFGSAVATVFVYAAYWWFFGRSPVTSRAMISNSALNDGSLLAHVEEAGVVQLATGSAQAQTVHAGRDINKTTNITYNYSADLPVANRGVAIRRLDELIREVNQLHSRVSDPLRTDDESLVEQIKQWHHKVREFFRAELDESYYTRMHSHHGLITFSGASGGNGWTEERRRWRTDIGNDAKRLVEILAELQHYQSAHVPSFTPRSVNVEDARPEVELADASLKDTTTDGNMWRVSVHNVGDTDTLSVRGCITEPDWWPIPWRPANAKVESKRVRRETTEVSMWHGRCRTPKSSLRATSQCRKCLKETCKYSA